MLLAKVVRQYLSLFITMNTYVEVSLGRNDRRDIEWPPILGTQLELQRRL